MKYWLNLFSGKTWDEFLSYGGTVSGFPPSQKSSSKKVKVGDRFICYVTKIGRFIGVLEVLSETYEDYTKVYSGQQPFPIRFKVKPLVTVKYEEGIPVLTYRDRLKMFESVENPKDWSQLVRSSLRTIDPNDGDQILRDLRSQKEHPVIREYDRKKLYQKSKIPVFVTPKGIVTIPEREDEEEEDAVTTPPTVGESVIVPEVSEHTEIEYLLLRLGSEMGFRVWVGRNDRNKEYEGHRFSEISGVMSELPSISIDKNTKTIIENIDVLWFRKSQPVSGFEVESTTSVYSGLLRLSDLVRTVPHLNTDLYIVYPDDRKEKVLREVNRPTFKEGVSPTLSERVRMISFSDLRSKMKKGEEIGLRYLPSEWVSEELSESCEIED